jgi:ABC-type branched-subunit amino acid transport system permease subunit
MQIFIRTILLGIVSGSVYALASTGLVLTFKTSGVLNFGYGAVAVFTSYVYWQFTVAWGWPVWPAMLVVCLVIAPLIGLALDTQLFRRIEGQPQIIGVIATVGLFVLLDGIAGLVWGGPSGNAAKPYVPSLFPHWTVPVLGGARIGVDQLGVLLVAALAAASLAALLRFTKIGIAFRAVVNNRPVAGLMGINTNYVSGLAWALSTSFAALTGILLTPRLFLDVNLLPPLIIAFVLGAAVVGYLRSLPLAYLGGLIIGVAEALLIQYNRSQGFFSDLRDAIPFLMIGGAVLAAPKAIRQSGTGASFVVKTREVAGHASARARLLVAVGFFGFLAVVPLLTGGSSSWYIQLTGGLAYAIIFLSLVILTGFSGQISLGHTAFMGIAAFSTAHFVSDLGLPAWIALLLGALAAVPAGMLIGFVAVRVHGLFLALMTLAFAFMAQQLFFQNTSISHGEGGVLVPRPEGFSTNGAFYYLVLVLVALVAAMAISLRTGRTGRVLAGMRDSETACRSLGIPVTRYKVLIFGLSAFVAGLGGILYSMIQQQATTRSFIPFYALFFMTIAVVGGIFHVGGALVAGVLFGVYPKLAEHWSFFGKVQLILFGLGATLALAKNPEGMFGELRRAGNALAGALARRNAASRGAPNAGGSAPRAGNEPRADTAEPLPVAGGGE